MLQRQKHVTGPLEFSTRRRLMVWKQLLKRGIHDHRVLDSMGTVPREEFVPPALRELAYEDCPLPIGCDQTISQPFTVAFMCQALRLDGSETVLEIGAGCGYGAAVLSRLAHFVYSMECVPRLAEAARERLVGLGYKNVAVWTGDGSLGLPEEAPFDAIVVTAAAETVPPTYIGQLEEGGRLVIPIGRLSSGQTLRAFTRGPTGVDVENLGRFDFVPLVGQYGIHGIRGSEPPVTRR